MSSAIVLKRLSPMKTIGGEVAFTFPEVIDALKACTQKKIAVLGVEVFRSVIGGHTTGSLSSYEVAYPANNWLEFVEANNTAARNYVLTNQRGDDHFYVLTAASEQELE